MTRAPEMLYTCPFVPAEWIAAHGLEPVRIRPVSGGGHVPAGLCPYVHAFMDTVRGREDMAAVVVTTTCDQMRRCSDVLRDEIEDRLFLMNVPATWQGPNAAGLYRSELIRFGLFMTTIGGAAPSNDRLIKCMTQYESARNCSQTQRPSRGGIPLALLGGPMTEEDMAIFGVVEQCGGSVVLDGTEGGERTAPARFDRGLLRKDPLQELVDAYFGSIPDPYRRPDSMLYDWLAKTIPQSGARGVILIRQVWCDKWHAEVHRLRDRLEVPLLDIVLGAEPAARHRIEAFMETIA